jgi:hypothetical protein
MHTSFSKQIQVFIWNSDAIVRALGLYLSFFIVQRPSNSSPRKGPGLPCDEPRHI